MVSFPRKSWSDPFGKGKNRSFRARRDALGPGKSCREVLPVAVGLNPGWKRTGCFIWYIVGRGGAEGHGEKRRLGVSGNLRGEEREAAFFPASAVTVRAEGSPPATASLFAEMVLGWQPVWFCCQSKYLPLRGMPALGPRLLYGEEETQRSGLCVSTRPPTDRAFVPS